MISGALPLIEKIIRRIESSGPIPFSDFMEMALYEPSWGYYVSGREPFGPAGDYYTSPEVHPLFGRMISRQIAQMAECVSASGPVTVVEAGPGTGTLAMTIMKSLREKNPEVFNRVNYRLVEASPVLTERQRGFLRQDEAIFKKAAWHASVDELSDFEGVLFSNELLDAFPVRRVIWKERLREILVDYQDGIFREALTDRASPELEAYFKDLPVHWSEGQEAEASFNLEGWIASVARKLTKGFVLTIDYGGDSAELVSLRRKRGTLLCYRNHQTSEDPYQWIGEQDMTAHVNFSVLQREGLRRGLNPLGYTEQAKFLIGLGILDEMEKLVQTLENPAEDQIYRAMKHLIHPEGLGPVYQVFVQQKNMDSCRLKGLRYARPSV